MVSCCQSKVILSSVAEQITRCKRVIYPGSTFCRVFLSDGLVSWSTKFQPDIARQLQDCHACSSVSVPSYRADDCRLVTDAGVRRLRSADTRTVVGRTQSSFGDRTFALTAPQLWNSLPSDIRQPDLSYLSSL